MSSLPTVRKGLAPGKGLSIAGLAQMLFKAEASEDFIRSLPAQSLYLALKHLGLTSCADILEAASIDQCRLLFDFDCWQKDQFNEEAFWEWLSIADDEHGLRLLQKFVKFVDLKLIGLMLARHVEVKTFEEKTDNPPAPGFYTPDQGFTWVHVTLEEGTRNFLLSRLLALIFETNADLFYQLLSISSVASNVELEEESYQEKAKRIQAEGFPSNEFAFELNSGLNENLLGAELKAEQTIPLPSGLMPSEPIVYDGVIIQPLADLMANIPSREEFEGELTLILNAAFIRWGIELSDEDLVRHWITKVRGAINIGIEMAMERSNMSPLGAYQALGLQRLYRFGLGRLQTLTAQAAKIPQEKLRGMAEDSAVFGIIAGARERFPEAPVYLTSNGKIESEGGQLRSGYRSIDHLSEIDVIRKLLPAL